MIQRTILRHAICLLTVLAFSAVPATAQEKLTPAQAKSLAREVYFHAYPIVLMDITMRTATNVPNANTVPLRAPVNQFAHARTYPGANERDVVRFNFDTLYSLAWLDVSQEPIVLSVPDTGGRYYLIELLDMWTDVFDAPGSRTTGTKAGHFAIVAEGWKGELPEGVQKIVAPTPMVWALGRTQTNGPADYANVHKVQDGYKLTPVSQWGKDYTPPADVPTDPSVDNKTPPMTQMNKMDGVTLFKRLAAVMKQCPPHGNDYPILHEMRNLGLEPGKDWDPSAQGAATVEAINAAAKEALPEMVHTIKTSGRFVNGWNILTDNIGTYGTSYRQRAVVALGGLGANLPQDAVYPNAAVDGDGEPLTGANRYLLRFEKGKLPPANAFWSVTMYDQDGFQVPNAISRFAIGDRDKLQFNEDGSLDLYVQSDSPGKDKESNWLPAAKEVFQLTLRIYSPRRDVLDGTWVPPAVQRAK